MSITESSLKSEIFFKGSYVVSKTQFVTLKIWNFFLWPSEISLTETNTYKYTKFLYNNKIMKITYTI